MDCDQTCKINHVGISYFILAFVCKVKWSMQISKISPNTWISLSWQYSRLTKLVIWLSDKRSKSRRINGLDFGGMSQWTTVLEKWQAFRADMDISQLNICVSVNFFFFKCNLHWYKFPNYVRNYFIKILNSIFMVPKILQTGLHPMLTWIYIRSMDRLSLMEHTHLSFNSHL